jgi:hypothetical protein
MITPIIKPKKTGRNDPCPCGSEKKYKKCCGKEQSPIPRLNESGLLAIMRKMIKDNGGSYEIIHKDLMEIPPKEGINVHWDDDEEKHVLTVVSLEQKKILVPDKRIIA